MHQIFVGKVDPNEARQACTLKTSTMLTYYQLLVKDVLNSVAELEKAAKENWFVMLELYLSKS